jgi:hypothetical protein
MMTGPRGQIKSTATRHPALILNFEQFAEVVNSGLE